MLFAYLAIPDSTCRGLLAQYRRTKSLRPSDRTSRTSFSHKCGPTEVALLAELDSLHDTLSGPATKVLARRAYARFGDTRYARLAENRRFKLAA